MTYLEAANILGISLTSTKKDLQKAYRALAKQYHPDCNKSKYAAEKFRKITEAKEVFEDYLRVMGTNTQSKKQANRNVEHDFHQNKEANIRKILSMENWLKSKVSTEQVRQCLEYLINGHKYYFYQSAKHLKKDGCFTFLWLSPVPEQPNLEHKIAIIEYAGNVKGHYVRLYSINNRKYLENELTDLVEKLIDMYANDISQKSDVRIDNCTFEEHMQIIHNFTKDFFNRFSKTI